MTNLRTVCFSKMTIPISGSSFVMLKKIMLTLVLLWWREQCHKDVIKTQCCRSFLHDGYNVPFE